MAPRGRPRSASSSRRDEASREIIIRADSSRVRGARAAVAAAPAPSFFSSPLGDTAAEAEAAAAATAAALAEAAAAAAACCCSFLLGEGKRGPSVAARVSRASPMGIAASSASSSSGGRAAASCCATATAAALGLCCHGRWVDGVRWLSKFACRAGWLADWLDG